VAWTVAGIAFNANGAIPTPAAVVRQYHADGWHFYLSNVGVTVRSAVIGFLWGNAAALAIAVLVLLVPALEAVATQFAVISYCMPLTAIGPIILVVFGGRAPSAFLAGMSVFFTTLVGALLGLKAADRTSMDLVRAYGGSRFTALRKVQVIAALPATIAGLKIAAPAALLGAIIGEYLGGVDSGLGVAITAAQQTFTVPRTWGLALVCGFVAGLGYLLIALFGRLVTPWERSSDAGTGRP
jgi:ABC-type nitrate/sulfonate/bicarbonate transport system permease component